MVNLLFISNNPKMEFIKKQLQPMLKVKIDVVTDFDHGLKDVFEKRPATIIIQDQISGVTGESVARHIQMLLGSGAPVFVLMHDGNSRIKPIKGLFEHIIDLTQPDTKLVEDVKAILKSILGSEWEKIIIIPKQDAAALVASFAMPDDSRVDADQLVNDFLSDLGTTDIFGQASSPQPFILPSDQQEEEELLVESTSDELARLLVESSQQTNVDDVLSVELQPLQPIEPAVTEVPHPPKKKERIPRAAKPLARKASPEETLLTTPSIPELPTATIEMVPVLEPEPEPEPEPVKLEQPVSDGQNITMPTAPMPDTAENTPHADALDIFATSPSPADFRIAPGSKEVHEEIPEDLLLAFEENYHSQTGTWKRMFIVVVVLIGFGAGGWVLVKQNPGLLSFLSKTSTSPTTLVPESGKPVTVPVAKPTVPPQNPVASEGKPNSAKSLVLPLFMSTARRDAAFVAQTPGWERYVGKVYEYRVFRSDDKIKVVQVLAGIGTQAVNEDFLTTVLREFVGSANYSVGSSEQKHGYLVQRGSVGQKADLLIYRSKEVGGIRAFVVSIN